MRKRNRKVKVIGLAGMLAVGLVAGSLPAEPVSAANGWEVDLNAGGNVEASSVSITMGGATNGQLNAGSTDPNKSAGLVKRTASVEIGATDGYTVTLSGNPNLTGVNSSNKIPTVTSNTTLAQMNNQWGWYTAEGYVDCSALQTMKQMKSTGDQIAAGTLDAKTTKQFTMCFGAKVNGNQAADTYSNTVTLSVVAQPKVVQTFGGIKTMQEMTSSICSAAAVNDTAYLRDTRDNKSYWVTKLADGNCWMSQNLDLDITTSNVKAADSDVTSDWNSSSSYPPVATITDAYSAPTSDTGTYSLDVGQYVIISPTQEANSECNSTSLGVGACASSFTGIDGRVASGNPDFYRLEMYNGTNGDVCTKMANTAVSEEASGPCAQYDSHYLVGNYYQWNAATAGTGGTMAIAEDATESVCPKGWRLPSSAIDDNTIVKGTYAFLLQQYGLATNYNKGSFIGTGINDAAGTLGMTYNATLSPLFFVRSGYLHTNDGIGLRGPFRFAGGLINLWSARSGTSTSASWALYSTGSSLVSSATAARYQGYSLRCLAR